MLLSKGCKVCCGDERYTCRKRRAEGEEEETAAGIAGEASEPTPTEGLTLGQRLEALQLRQQGVSAAFLCKSTQPH